MPRTTPQDSFAEAQAAVTRQDWVTLFACIDRVDLIRIASNGINHLVNHGSPAAQCLSGLGAEHGLTAAVLADLQQRAAAILTSAQACLSANSDASLAAALEQSQRHKAVVDHYQAGLAAVLRAVPDLARFTAALEQALRAETGRGSVSTDLFADETLEAVSIDGNRAHGLRRRANAETSEPIEFVKRRSGWLIRLRPPRRRR